MSQSVCGSVTQMSKCYLSFGYNYIKYTITNYVHKQQNQAHRQGCAHICTPTPPQSKKVCGIVQQTNFYVYFYLKSKTLEYLV